jgi:signal recognition particle subunit SRP54
MPMPSEKEIEEMAAQLQQGGGPKLPGLGGLGGLPGFNPFKK